MNNIERFTLELARNLAEGPARWIVTDDQSYLVPEDLKQIKTLHETVKSCAHILLKDDLETRIERARRELEFLEGLR